MSNHDVKIERKSVICDSLATWHIFSVCTEQTMFDKWVCDVYIDMVWISSIIFMYSKVSNKRADLLREQDGIFLKKC